MQETGSPVWCRSKSKSKSKSKSESRSMSRSIPVKYERVRGLPKVL